MHGDKTEKGSIQKTFVLILFHSAIQAYGVPSSSIKMRKKSRPMFSIHTEIEWSVHNM